MKYPSRGGHNSLSSFVADIGEWLRVIVCEIVVLWTVILGWCDLSGGLCHCRCKDAALLAPIKRLMESLDWRSTIFVPVDTYSLHSSLDSSPNLHRLTHSIHFYNKHWSELVQIKSKTLHLESCGLPIFPLGILKSRKECIRLFRLLPPIWQFSPLNRYIFALPSRCAQSLLRCHIYLFIYLLSFI